MRTADVDIILVPADGRLPAGHWLARWQRNLKTARTVDPPADGLDAVDRWRAELRKAVAAATGRPVVLVGHGQGALVAAATAPELVDRGLAGVILVAPADPDHPPAALPPVTERLLVPALVIASRTDPACTFERAAALAGAWGADLVDAGAAGGIDQASGHGPWPEGLMRLGWFLERLGRGNTPLQ